MQPEGGAILRKTVSQLLDEARERIAPRRQPAEVPEAVGRGALLVDLRSVDERERFGVIPGSLHVPRSVLEWRADPTSGWTSPHLGDLEAEVILVCAEGYSSSLAAASLHDLGYARATDLIGGFTAWKASGFPVRQAMRDRSELPGLGPPEPAEPVESVTVKEPPSLDALRAQAGMIGVEPSDEDLERVRAFLSVLLPAFAELERVVPADLPPAALFVPEGDR